MDREIEVGEASQRICGGLISMFFLVICLDPEIRGIEWILGLLIEEVGLDHG